jgi:multiple sugar transport system substrate-binding protein
MKGWRGVTVLVCVSLASLLWLPGPAIAADKEVIRFWTLLDLKDPGPRSEALRLILAQFEKKQPNIHVQVETVPWHQIDQQLIQASAAGKGPDVSIVSGQVIAQHIRAKTLIPLDDFVARWPVKERNDFLIPLKQTTFDGKIMGLFFQHRVAVLYYREDYLKAKGLAVPKSWAELVDAGRKLADGNVVGFAWGLDPRARATALTEPLVSMFWAAGEEILDANGKATFNSPAGVKVYQFINDLVQKKAMDQSVASYTYEDVFQAVKSGTVAMNFLGSHRVVAAREAGSLGEKLKTAPLPGAIAGKPAPAHVFGWTLAIGKDSTHREAAWKFIDHMLTYESRLIDAKLSGELPSRKSVYEDPWFKTEGARELKSWADYAGTSGRVFTYPEKYVRMSELLAEAAQEMVLQGASAQQVLDKAARKYNELR